ncbi:hypothetical protein M430DRAFT_37584 [Amorphotheca resinae ATCC 22711]|jgi:hypothetical protein|uniref:WSC domain-containing protein n=1 Tax=Amorphotheca resinae ATCC 22711 TaxID=857342 RepID=A0A2T3APK0_AMORE|nr:hypothetical protein M430DRAFT_37584 [Amorphotheca resinae ATCC 22711]PSS06933.1 hypothetical protein M430DRAFT_37584 [Amorphotheca resinae ATCC 22711]
MRARFKTTTALLLAASSLPLSSAFKSISINETVHANETIALRISNDLSAGPDSFDSQFSTYRIYLAIVAPSSSNIPHSLEPSCYLVNATSINETSPEILIPPSVGQDGTSYSIVTMEYSTDPHGARPSGYEYSTEFQLLNTSGTWTRAEIHGVVPLFPDLLPCTAYDCARQCMQTYYPGNVNGTFGEAGFRDTYVCVANCSGVAYPPWEAIEAEGAAKNDPLAGAGNEGAQTIMPAYASLLTSNPPTPTPTTTLVNSTMTVLPTTTTTSASPTATGKKSEGARGGRSTGEMMGMLALVGLGVVAQLVL